MIFGVILMVSCGIMMSVVCFFFVKMSSVYRYLIGCSILIWLDENLISKMVWKGVGWNGSLNDKLLLKV